MSTVADFKDSNGLWAKSYRNTGVDQVQTYSYQRWSSMRKRCAVGGATQKKYPTYTGCMMSPLFADFQLFTDWHRQQIGYDMQRYQLDKDILFSGNKAYSEYTCVLVPSQLNSFLLTCGAARGEYPQGVYWSKQSQKFKAQLCIDGKRKYLGYHASAEAASTAYKVAKNAEAKRWYERLKAGEFIVDNRVIERMFVWTI